MAITVEELPGFLRKLGDKVAEEAPPKAAKAMGLAFQRHVVTSMRGPSPSPPGTPPARVSGTLARSVRTTDPVRVGEASAEVSVAPHTVYARIQQYGGVIRARHLTRDGRPGFLRWEDKSGVHYRHTVTLPARPYMNVDASARVGVHNAAVRVAMQYLPGAGLPGG